MNYLNEISSSIFIKDLESSLIEIDEYRKEFEEVQKNFSFEIDKKISFGIPTRMAKSITIFYPTIKGSDPKKDQVWMEKYIVRFEKFIRDWNRNRDWIDWTLLLWISPNCSFILDLIPKDSERIEVNLMSKNPSSYGEGIIWRFSPFNDRRFDIIRSSDSDENEQKNLFFFSNFLRDDKALSFQFNESTKIDKKGIHSAINAAVVCGCRFYVKPQLIDFDVKRSIHLYFAWRNYRISIGKGRTDTDEEVLSDYNLPIGEHKWGWGNLPHLYCSDEKWLKTIFLSELASRSLVSSYYPNKKIVSKEEQAFNLWMIRQKNLVQFIK